MNNLIENSEDCMSISNEDKATSFESNYFADKKDSPFIIEHKWEGRIIEIFDDGSMKAKLYNIEEGEWDILEFRKEDINSDDISLLKVGALFNFYIGYLDLPAGRIKSKLYKFRRIHLKNNIDSILDSMRKNDFRSVIENF